MLVAHVRSAYLAAAACARACLLCRVAVTAVCCCLMLCLLPCARGLPRAACSRGCHHSCHPAALTSIQSGGTCAAALTHTPSFLGRHEERPIARFFLLFLIFKTHTHAHATNTGASLKSRDSVVVGHRTPTTTGGAPTARTSSATARGRAT